MNLGVVLLAAGGSSRMGEKHKLLLPWGDSTVVAQALVAALGAPVGTVVVVTGHRAEEVEQACSAGGGKATFVHNPDWNEGMYGSVLAGVAKLPPETDGFFLALGDMPLVPAKVYAELARVYATRPGHIIVPLWEGRRGHPVLLPVKLVALNRPAAADEGLRGVLRRFPELVVQVPVPCPGVCIDLDTPEEYVKYLPGSGINPEQVG